MTGSIFAFPIYQPCGLYNSVDAMRAYTLKWQNSDPRSSETLQDIEMRFGVLDYVVDESLQKKFGVAPPKGGGPTEG